MGSSEEKRFIRQLYPELNTAVSDLLNNPDHKHQPYLYDDLGRYLKADKYNGKFLVVVNYYCYFNGTRKITERLKFTIPMRVVIVTNVGLFVLKADAKIERQKDGTFLSVIEGYQVDSYISESQ